MEQKLFSQAEIAELLGVSSDAVSLQIKKLKQARLDVGEVTVREARTEGLRTVNRSIKRYPIQTVQAIATRQCGILAVTNKDLMPDVVVLRPEIHFAELISCFAGPFAMYKQHPFGRYRVDFFFPDAMLVVEYDEEAHSKAQISDQRRQAWIESRFGVKFIRVQEGDEIHGLQRIVCFLFEWHESIASSGA